MKKIAVVSTGGTIAGTGEAGKASSYKAGQLDVQDILATIPQLKDMAQVEVIPVCSLDSNDLGPAELERLRKTVQELDQDPSVDGIVITHGTDTLEETAFLLNLVLDMSKPVVMTGAMRPASSVSADGPMNLYQAIALASEERTADMGLLCVFSNTIYSGRDIAKAHTFKTDAFENGMGGAVGFMQDDKPILTRMPLKRHTHDSVFANMAISDLPAVGIYAVHEGCDLELLDWMLDRYDGLVLSGTGAGNCSRAVMERLESHPDCVVVRSSRVADSFVPDSPVLDPQERTIASGDLSPWKSRILLQLALAKDMDVRQVFDSY